MGNLIEDVNKSIAKYKVDFSVWVKTQPIAIAAVSDGVMNGLQGAFLGGVLGSLNAKVLRAAADSAGQTNNPMVQSQLAMSGPPHIMARNFFVLTGVNAGAATAIRRARNGVDDVYTTMWAAFASGAAFSLVSSLDSPDPAQRFNLMSAFSGGTIFGLFSGLFYNVGQMFTGPKVEETGYIRTKYMLKNLGLDTYEKNFKGGQLDDRCLMLLNNSALKEAKVPPGPRLLILSYVDYYRNQSKAHQALLPAMPMGGMGLLGEDENSKSKKGGKNKK